MATATSEPMTIMNRLKKRLSGLLSILLRSPAVTNYFKCLCAPQAAQV
jgi:hypothetical protein